MLTHQKRKTNTHPHWGLLDVRDYRLFSYTENVHIIQEINSIYLLKNISVREKKKHFKWFFNSIDWIPFYSFSTLIWTYHTDAQFIKFHLQKRFYFNHNIFINHETLEVLTFIFMLGYVWLISLKLNEFKKCILTSEFLYWTFKLHAWINY